MNLVRRALVILLAVACTGVVRAPNVLAAEGDVAITGTLRGWDGAPVLASVDLSAPGGTQPVVSTGTDETGRFQFSAPPGDYGLSVIGRTEDVDINDRCPVAGDPSCHRVAAGGAPWDITLQRKARVTVRVVPVTYVVATLDATTRGHGYDYQHLDSYGGIDRYSGFVQPGEYELSISDPYHEWTRLVSCREVPATCVRVVAAHDLNLTIAVAPGRGAVQSVIEGIVLLDGVPLAQHAVAAVGKDGRGSGSITNATTDDVGRYAVTVDAPGNYSVLVAGVAGREPCTAGASACVFVARDSLAFANATLSSLAHSTTPGPQLLPTALALVGVALWARRRSA